MAMRLFEGFNRDVLATNSPLWTFNFSSTTYYDTDNTDGRNGTNCLRIAAGLGGEHAKGELWSAAPEDSTMVVGMALKSEAFDTGFDVFEFVSEAGVVWTIRTHASMANTLCVNVGGVDYGAVGVSTTAFDFLEFVVDMDAAAGSVTIFKNGTQVHQTTGIDTKDATGDIKWIKLYGDTSDLEYWIDDLYILDDQGGGLTSRLGDVHVETLQPTSHSATHNAGVGSDGNSTDNHLLVDDTLPDPDSADYVELQTAADRDAYGTGTLAAGIVPKAVKVVSVIGFGDGTATAVDGFLRLSATDYDAADPETIDLAYRDRDWVWDQNPATASAWAEDDLDGVEFGIKRTG